MERNHRGLSLSLVITFFSLALIATINPSLIDDSIIQSLAVPTLILSIITTLHMVFLSADDICYSDFDRAKEEYKKFDEWRIHLNALSDDTMYGDENIGKHLTNLRIEMDEYKVIGKMLVKYIKTIRGIEVVALVIFLLSAIIRPNIFPVNEKVIACWSLSIMLLSLFFSTTLSEWIYDKLLKKIEKNSTAAQDDTTIKDDLKTHSITTEECKLDKTVADKDNDKE